MLTMTQFSGFAAGATQLVQALIDRTLGTALGNLTDDAGLAAAFDGDTSETVVNCATKSLGVFSVTIGKNWGAGVTKTVNGFKVWGSSDRGFKDEGGPVPDVSAKLQGSTDNFGASIVTLGTVAATADSNGKLIQKLSGINESTAYRYHRLLIEFDLSSGKSAVAECQFFEDVEQ